MENTAHENMNKLPLPWLVQVFRLMIWGFLVAIVFFAVLAVSSFSSSEEELVFVGVCLSAIWPLAILHGIHTRRASAVMSIRIFCAINALIVGGVIFSLLLFDVRYLPSILFCAFAFFLCWFFYWMQSTEVLHVFSKPLDKTHTEIPWGIGALRALLLLSASVHSALLFFFFLSGDSQDGLVLQIFCLFLLFFVYWQTRFTGCNKHSFFFALAILSIVLCVANTASFIVFAQPAGYNSMLTVFNVQELAYSLFWLLILVGWRLAVSQEDTHWFSHAVPEKSAGKFSMRIMTAVTESRACACSLLFFICVMESQQRLLFIQAFRGDTTLLFAVFHAAVLIGGVCVFLRTLTIRNENSIYTLCAVFSCLVLVLHGIIAWRSAEYFRGSFTSVLFLFWMVFFFMQRGVAQRTRKEEATPLPIVFFRGVCLYLVAEMLIYCLHMSTYENGWEGFRQNFGGLPALPHFFMTGCFVICLLCLLHQVYRWQVSLRALQILFVITGCFAFYERTFASLPSASHSLFLFLLAASAYFSMSTKARAWVQKRKNMAKKRESPVSG